MPRIYIETYGCSANRSESEIIAGILEKQGMEIVDSSDSADIAIINTCVVKQPTETKIFYRIRKLNEEGKKIIVAGCMPEVRQKEIMRLFPDACLVSTHQIKNIPEAIQALMSKQRRYFVGKSKEENICMPRHRHNKFIAIIEISKGCTGGCTYCAVKGVKGELFSYSSKSIIKEIKTAVSDGCKEIWLTSQDCGCYGKDKGETLVHLLKEIEKVPGEFRIRVGMMNPEHILTMLDDLIECFKNPRVYKFLHIPIQTGSDKILKSMGRKYQAKDTLKIISGFRKEIPEINIWTDIIIGFPGENEEDSKATIDILEKIKPGFTNISKFGAMKNTPAAIMEQVDRETINKQARKITEICERIQLNNNKQHIGLKKKILITERGNKGTLKGRDMSFKQIVLKDSDGKIGDLVEKRINSAAISGLSTL